MATRRSRPLDGCLVHGLSPYRSALGNESGMPFEWGWEVAFAPLRCAQTPLTDITYGGFGSGSARCTRRSTPTPRPASPELRWRCVRALGEWGGSTIVVRRRRDRSRSPAIHRGPRLRDLKRHRWRWPGRRRGPDALARLVGDLLRRMRRRSRPGRSRGRPRPRDAARRMGSDRRSRQTRRSRTAARCSIPP